MAANLSQTYWRKKNCTPTLLSRLRKPFAGWLQMVALVCMTLQPAFEARAVYIPDPVYLNTPGQWVPLSGESSSPGGSPSMDYADGNGVPDWLDAYNYAIDHGQLAFWPGGTFHINGIEVSLAGLWHAAPSVDSDGDGLPLRACSMPLRSL